MYLGLLAKIKTEAKSMGVFAYIPRANKTTLILSVLNINLK